eukprot:TRINITY_DN6380_c1_g3_i4.p2 TRINITY_DN6380_c1_g3~~TRINITY_DN6380_c1_g3_i4.p2  ORF type:complete len:128 (+),score=15.83 TRINITY_DN6380_c1_g3_i4:358-741(+)
MRAQGRRSGDVVTWTAIQKAPTKLATVSGPLPRWAYAKVDDHGDSCQHSGVQIIEDDEEDVPLTSLMMDTIIGNSGMNIVDDDIDEPPQADTTDLVRHGIVLGGCDEADGSDEEDSCRVVSEVVLVL